jgi:N-acetylmuramoyl-L-alanine amidase
MTSANAKTFVLTAGHSGTDPGALSHDKRHKEATLAVQLRDKTAAHLFMLGVTVIEDGRAGENRPLRDALVLARGNPGRAVEIHFNAGPPTAAGVEALSHPAHKRLAQAIAQAVAGVLRSKLRGEQGWKPANSGRHHRLAFCDAGGVILETIFLSNPKELAVYLENIDRVAERLAAAIAGVIDPPTIAPATATNG